MSAPASAVSANSAATSFSSSHPPPPNTASISDKRDWLYGFVYRLPSMSTDDKQQIIRVIATAPEPIINAYLVAFHVSPSTLIDNLNYDVVNHAPLPTPFNWFERTTSINPTPSGLPPPIHTNDFTPISTTASIHSLSSNANTAAIQPGVSMPQVPINVSSPNDLFNRLCDTNPTCGGSNSVRICEYVMLAGPSMEGLAESLVRASASPQVTQSAYGKLKFHYFPSSFLKFPGGTDHIELGGFTPRNFMHGANVLFLTSFHSNDVTMSQLHALFGLAESFINTLTILLPFLPQATMERTTKEGVIATANTTAKILSALPLCGRPARVMLYDLHTLQNRFYFGNHALASLHSTFPLLVDVIHRINSSASDNENKKLNCVCFPDDGAEKRFNFYFQRAFPTIEVVTCGKHRDESDPNKRVVVIGNGNAGGKNVVIVDDLVRSGGTLVECARALKKQGARSVSVFVAHAAFEPHDAYRAFLKGGKHEGTFEKFYMSNSNPFITDNLPRDSIFDVLDLTPLIIKDLEFANPL